MKKYPHAEGETKTELFFAWWPERVEGKLIWLRYYEVVMQYTIRNRIVDTGRMIVSGRIGGWDIIQKRLIQKNERKRSSAKV